jgi:AraC-like DNA-binding protein
MWREEICRAFCGLDIRPSDGMNIDCQMRINLIGGIALAVPSGSSAQFSRTKEVLSDGCDDLVLVTSQWGHTPLMQDGREIPLVGSQMCLTDMSVLGTVGQDFKGEFTTTRIPRKTLLNVSPRAEDRLSIVLSENAVLRETIMRYHALSADVSHQLDVVGQQMMAQHLTDLISLLLGTGAEQADRLDTEGRAAAQLDLIRADALRDLDNQELTIAGLARRYGLSARHAQRLFERTGNTFTEFVLEQRLLLAHRQLSNPQHRHSKISDIAHSAGFSDLSYFNRAFRKRFGATPSDIRGG